MVELQLDLLGFGSEWKRSDVIQLAEMNSDDVLFQRSHGNMKVSLYRFYLSLIEYEMTE